jgi:phage tail sheath protein FI|tara:strand:+ start:512 stop:2239 length:1728 start_codon:yes stop_codon:yes gene_type:complete
MAEIILSPGVLANENDQSQIRSLPVVAGAAIIGPTVKGKPNIPRLVTTFSEFQAEFGTTFVSGSTEEFSFLTSISANNYFQQGGTSLLVTRVATGSFAPATSSLIPTGSAIGPSPDTSPFVLETLSEGEILNSTGTPGTNGILPLGTSDNLRWEITQPSTDLGVFTLLIRRGDDTTNSKTILETFTNLSLDPKQSNYIERVVGNQVQNLVGSGQADVYVRTTGSYANASRFVRVKQVNFPTPNYFDNNGSAKAQFTSSIPAASSGTFGGATGKVFDGANTLYQNIGTRTQGLTEGNYTDAINLLSNKDEYQFNVISTPGLNNADHGTPVGNLIEMVENRGDAIAIVDLVRYGSTITTVTSEAGERDSSFAAAYWPWLQVAEPNNGQIVWVPASTLIPGVYANTDATAETWFAPAGFNRGGLLGVVQAERKLSQSQRDTLYVGKVNPIATFPGRGVVVFGQKTLQQQQTALDRVNVRRLLISLKSFISQVSDNLVFEQNTAATRNNFLAQVNPFLESVQQRQGLFAFKVVMDDTNNTPDVIDRNQLVGQIFLQPTRTAEFILLDFNILPTGATFPS